MPPHLPLTVSTPRLGIHTSVSAIALARRYYVAISGAIVHSSRHSSTQAQNSRIGIANRNGYGYGHGHSNGIGTGNRIAAESVCGSIFRTASAVRASSSSSSSTRWKSRQGKDAFAREAKVKGLKSRAAFKLLEIDAKHRIFKRGQTVVDLGYAPGSWSQVAVARTKPTGRILGIDIIPAQPPKGVSTIQGNFLSPLVQESVKQFLLDPDRGRPLPSPFVDIESDDIESQDVESEPEDEDISQSQEPLSSPDASAPTPTPTPTLSQTPVPLEETSYIDMERHITDTSSLSASSKGSPGSAALSEREKSWMVDVVLSDMCEPWEQTTGFWKRSLSDPYTRMMNTTGIKFSDHAGSMDLCAAALRFAFDTLKPGGHFVCKFYQGSEDKQLELQLKKLFQWVHREKPESSRSESKEAYFVALRRKRDVDGAALGYEDV